MLTTPYLTQLMACSLALLFVFFVAPCTGQNTTATNSTTAANTTNTGTAANTTNTGTATNTTNTATASNGTQTANGSQISTSPAATNQTAGKYHFDCKRKGETCAPGVTCDLASGKCLCTSWPSDYMCYPITPASNCPYPCQNGGICAATLIGPLCSCPDSYYGADCSLDIVQVLCDQNKMYINVNPSGIFSGTMYVQNYPSCTLNFLGNADAKNKISQYSDYQKNPTAFVDFEGYGREILNDDATCGIVSVENGVNTRRILIQYDLLFKSSVDQVVVARCSSNAQKTTIYLDPVTVNDYNSNMGQIETDGKGGIVKLNLVKSDGLPATAVNLGDPISLVFAMAGGGTGASSDFYIKTCTANNTKAGADLKQVTFIQNGCPTDVGKSIITGLPTRTTNAGSIRVTINLKAFLFLGSSSVAFFCSIEFCTTTCATPSCSSVPVNNPPATSNSSSGNNVNPPVNNPVNGSNSSNTNPAVNSSNTNPGNSSNLQNHALANGSNPSSTQRKRRDAPTQGDVGALLTVNDPDNTSGQQNTSAPPTTKEPPTTEDCINNPKITAVVAILAACVGLLLIVSACLAFLLVASKRKKAPSSHYSSPVETVRIPRLEMYNTHQAGI